jgi:large subunit ribosomal protein L1
MVEKEKAKEIIEEKIEQVSEDTKETKPAKKTIISIADALAELRKEENKRKFVQTVDLVINLQNFDVRKEALNTFITIPHPSEKKIAAFLTKKSELVDTITESGFVKYKDNKDIKKLSKQYDAFMAVAPMMGKVATKFGRVLGPVGKMPSPQAGIITKETDEAISGMLDKMKKSVRIRTKEKSIKLKIGNEKMSDSDLKENIEATLEAIEKTLPRGKESMKNALVKLTMSKPIKILDNRRK